MRKLLAGIMCLVPLVGFCMYSQTSNHQHQNFSHHSQYSQNNIIEWGDDKFNISISERDSILENVKNHLSNKSEIEYESYIYFSDKNAYMINIKPDNDKIFLFLFFVTDIKTYNKMNNSALGYN